MSVFDEEKPINRVGFCASYCFSCDPFRGNTTFSTVLKQSVNKPPVHWSGIVALYPEKISLSAHEDHKNMLDY